MPHSNEALHYAVWPTAWGPMGAVAARALQRVVLPHYQMNDLAQLLAWEHAGAVQDQQPFERLIELTVEYFRGRRVDFSEIDCELPAAHTFTGKVLRVCRTIPYGQTRSYGQLARQTGGADAARAVATALGKNPLPLVVPCHRVTYSDGGSGGFSAPGGVALKQRMLSLESPA